MNQDSQKASGSNSHIDRELQKLQKSTKRWQWGLVTLTIINLVALAWVFDIDKLILNNGFISEKVQVISPKTEDIKIKPEEEGGMHFKNKDSPIWTESEDEIVEDFVKSKIIGLDKENDSSIESNDTNANKLVVEDPSVELQNIPSEILTVLNANRALQNSEMTDSNELTENKVVIENQIDEGKEKESSDINLDESNLVAENLTTEESIDEESGDIQINNMDTMEDDQIVSNNEVEYEEDTIVESTPITANNENIVNNNESTTDSVTDKNNVSLIIQFASLKSKKLAESEWIRLKKIYPQLMNDLEPKITEVIIKDKGTFFRLQSNIPHDTKNPKNLCELFKQLGQQCFLINSEL